MMAGKLVPLGTILGQDDDEALVASIEELWREGKIPGPVFGRRRSNHMHEPIQDYHRLEILWCAAAPAGDYYDGEYDSEAYAHPRLSGLRPPGADYERNSWKDIAFCEETIKQVSAVVGGRKPAARRPSREKPFWPEARKVAFQWLEDEGCPAPDDGHQAELERHIADWLSTRGHEASEPAIRRHVAGWIAERRTELGI
jgi:hypothetical protein